MIDDVLLAILSLPVCVSDLRAKVSPLVVATDASEWGPAVSRTSSLTAQGRVALQELQKAIPSCSGSVGLVELFAGVGGLRRALEHCDVFPRFMSQEEEAAAQRVLQASWPDVHVVDHVAHRSHATLRPHIRMWIVGGQHTIAFVGSRKSRDWSACYDKRSLIPRSLLSRSAPRTLMWTSEKAFHVL